MIEILFERPLVLGSLLVPAILVLLGIWNRTRSTRAARALLVGIACSILFFAVQAAVKTDRERMRLTVERLADWVQRGDVDRIVGLIDPQADFGGHGHRDDFELLALTLLGKYTIDQPKVSAFEFQIEDDHAQVDCKAWCTVQSSQWTYPIHSTWRLAFRKVGAQWRITNITPHEIAGQQYRSLWSIP